MRTKIRGMQGGIAELFAALSGGADAAGVEAEQDETRRLAHLAVQKEKARKLAADAGISEDQLAARRRVGDAVDPSLTGVIARAFAKSASDVAGMTGRFADQGRIEAAVGLADADDLPAANARLVAAGRRPLEPFSTAGKVVADRLSLADQFGDAAGVTRAEADEEGQSIAALFDELARDRNGKLLTPEEEAQKIRIAEETERARVRAAADDPMEVAKLETAEARAELLRQEADEKARSTEQGRQLTETAVGIIDGLLSPERRDAVEAAVGPVSSRLPTFDDETRDVELDVERLRAILTRDFLGLLSGVLSDTDIALLQRMAAGKISIDAGEEGFLSDLAQARNALVSGLRALEAGGVGATGGAPGATGGAIDFTSLGE